MQFDSPLIPGQIQKRYKRFFVDVKLVDGTIVTAHCPNTGSMESCIGTGWPCLLSTHNNPKRKLKFGLEMISNGKSWIGVNTHLPNQIVKEAIIEGKIPELAGYSNIQSEYKIENSRFDLFLSHGQKKCFVEVKNVTLRDNYGVALFPDAVTERGKKHLDDLKILKSQGNRACMFYFVQREDVHIFRPAYEIDPEYSKKLEESYKFGVEIFVYQASLSPQGIKINNPLPFTFKH